MSGGTFFEGALVKWDNGRSGWFTARCTTQEGDEFWYAEVVDPGTFDQGETLEVGQSVTLGDPVARGKDTNATLVEVSDVEA